MLVNRRDRSSSSLSFTSFKFLFCIGNLAGQQSTLLWLGRCHLSFGHSCFSFCQKLLTNFPAFWFPPGFCFSLTMTPDPEFTPRLESESECLYDIVNSSSSLSPPLNNTHCKAVFGLIKMFV